MRIHLLRIKIVLLAFILSACIPGENLVEPTSDTYLDNVTFSGGVVLDNEFSPTVTSYSATVNSDFSTIEVRPITSIVGAEIAVNGIEIPLNNPAISIQLATGRNSVIIAIKNPETSNKVTYIFNITRQVNLASGLENLRTSQGKLEPFFSADVLDYTVNLDYSVRSLSLIPTSSARNSSIYVQNTLVTSGSSSSDIQLPVGTTSVNIEVGSNENATKVNYTLNINRADIPELNSAALLSSLNLSPVIMDLTFDPEVTQYSGIVTNEITELTLLPTVDREIGASITINDDPIASGGFYTLPLDEGVNTIRLQVVAQDGVASKSYLLTITRLLNSNANLASLSTSTGALNPSFSKFVTNYSTQVDSTVASTEITANTAFPDATVTINGNSSPAVVALAEGENVIDIVAVSTDGSVTKTYKINIFRKSVGNADLAALNIPFSILDPKFNKLTTTYTVTVPTNISNFYVTPTALDSTSTIAVQGTPIDSGKNSPVTPLVIGSNEIDITVTSANSLVTKTYTLDVIRKGSGNNAIASLDLSSGSVSRDYDAGPNMYTAVVANNVSSLSVTPTVIDPKATITVNSVAVNSGEASNAMPLFIGVDNIFNIVTTAEDGAEATYTITVTRQGSSNADLSNFTLSSGATDQVFSSALANYTQVISNGTVSLTVTPVSMENGTTITVNDLPVPSGAASNAINLVDGINQISIRVTAADGSTVKIYQISVEKHASNNTKLSALTISESAFTTAFSEDVFSYSLSVEKPVTSLTVTPTAAAIGATIKVNGFNVPSGNASASISLAVGSNTISVEVTSVDTTASETYTINVERLLSKVADLSSITLSGVTLSPTFDVDTTSYLATVPNETTSLTLTPTLSDILSAVTVNTESIASGTASSSFNLSVGNNNIFDALVTAEDGVAQKNYTVRIRRLQNTNADLGSLGLSEGVLSPIFDPAVTVYSTTVRNSITSIALTPTTFMAEADNLAVEGTDIASGATVNTSYLYVGTKTIPIVITAEDTSVSKSYSLAITRQSASSENRLSDLTFSAGTLSQAFNPVLTNYVGNTPNISTSVDVTPVLWDSYSTVSVNGQSTTSGVPVNIQLVEGPNTIIINVVAENGTSNSYMVIMSRALSSDATLSSLKIGALALTPTFDSGTTSYSATPTNLDSSLAVIPVANYQATLVKVNGIGANPSVELNLDVGANVLTIDTTAQDNVTTLSYVVTLNRPADIASTNADLADLKLSSGELDITFDPNTLTYNATVGFVANTINVIAEKLAPEATITVNGTDSISGKISPPTPLTEGASTAISVVVTAGDGATTKTYTINVTRESSASFAQRAFVKASNTGSSDEFGISVAISGNTMVVGAHREDRTVYSSGRETGAVYIFVRDAVGTWSEQAVLRATNYYRYDYFGRRVAIWGDVIAITSSGEDSNVTGPINAFAFPPAWSNTSASSSGSVHIYRREAGVWIEEAFIKATNPGNSDVFGTSIDLSEDTLVVGAPYEDSNSSSDQADNSASNSGAVYTYTRLYDIGSSMWIWSFDKYHKSPTPRPNDRFGYSVAIDGDTFVVGTQGESSSSTGINSLSNTSGSENGAVFVYTRVDGVWNSPTYIKPAVTDNSDYFGSVVDIYQDTLVVGAPGEDSIDPLDPENDGSSAVGAAYVFTRTGLIWTQSAYLKTGFPRALDYFGTSAAVGSNMIAIGQVGNDSGATGINGDQSDTTLSYSGAVYLYNFNGSSWVEDKFIKQNIVGSGDSMGGYSSSGATFWDTVDIDGDTLVVGATGEDSNAMGINGDAANNNSTNSGATYILK